MMMMYLVGCCVIVRNSDDRVVEIVSLRDEISCYLRKRGSNLLGKRVGNVMGNVRACGDWETMERAVGGGWKTVEEWRVACYLLITYRK